MLLLDSFLNECCFKGCSLSLKVHKNRKQLPGTWGHQGVKTPQYLGHRRVVTPRYLGPWGVFWLNKSTTPQYLGHRVRVETPRYFEVIFLVSVPVKLY